MRQENERVDQGEGVQNSGETSTDVRGRDMGVEEGTGKEIGGRRNENMLRCMCGDTMLDKMGNERIKGTAKVGEIAKKVQERRLTW